MQLEPDPVLFWRVRRTAPGANSLGFVSKEISVSKPSEVFRILFLGDSVTEQGFPDIVERLLNARYLQHGRKVDAVKLAVSGYSSYQGRIMAEMYGRSLKPDLAFVFFGWNDHWQAYGETDAEKAPKVRKPGFGQRLVRLSRLVQWLSALGVRVRGARPPLEEMRVPLPLYRENLGAIKATFRSAGVPLVLVTAPTAHYRLGVPDYLVHDKFVHDKESALITHRRYNEVVRDVATGDRVFVLDLERDLSFRSAEDLATIFTNDGIHLTAIGLATVAGRAVDLIETTLPAFQRRRDGFTGVDASTVR